MYSKRGLSDIITSVLIILFAIIAVTIVGGIVLNQINKAGSKVESLTACNDLGLEPVKCIYNDETTSPAVGLLYRKTGGGSDIQLTQIDLLVERADKTIVNRTYVDAGHIPASMQTIWGALANYITPGAIVSTNLPAKFRIAASFKDSKGKIVKCSPFAKEVKCVKGGITARAQPLDTKPEVAKVNVLCNEGVLTGFDSVTPILPNGRGSGYQSASFATIVEKSDRTGGNAIVYLSNIDSNGGIQKNGITLIDGGSGWTLSNCNPLSFQAYVN